MHMMMMMYRLHLEYRDGRATVRHCLYVRARVYSIVNTNRAILNVLEGLQYTRVREKERKSLCALIKERAVCKYTLLENDLADY